MTKVKTPSGLIKERRYTKYDGKNPLDPRGKIRGRKVIFKGYASVFNVRNVD